MASGPAVPGKPERSTLPHVVGPIDHTDRGPPAEPAAVKHVVPGVPNAPENIAPKPTKAVKKVAEGDPHE